MARLLEIFQFKRAAKAYSIKSLQSNREPLPEKRGLTLISGLLSASSPNAIYKVSSVWIHRAHRLYGHRNNLIAPGQFLIGYFSNFLVEAISAAPPAVTEVEFRYEFAIVSMTVTSHTAHFPVLQGTNVMPSGRFPSDLDRPTGSFKDGTPARVRARQTKSFKL